MTGPKHTSNDRHKDAFTSIVERLRLAELQGYTDAELIAELKRRGISIKVKGVHREGRKL